jgi:hypothetical protein
MTLRGINGTDRSGVAASHYPTARLAGDGGDLAKLLPFAEASYPRAEMSELTPTVSDDRRQNTPVGGKPGSGGVPGPQPSPGSRRQGLIS